nr:MAG TPA: homing endonuclease [Caudoviricetes sp.]
MKKHQDKDYLYKEFIINHRMVKDIAQECGVSIGSIEQYLKRYGIKRGNIKYRLNEAKLDTTNPIFMYYCGLISTDGYMDKAVNRVSLRCSNLGCDRVFEKIKEYLEWEGSITKYRKCYDITPTSSKLKEVLISVGVSPLGKIHNEFPKEFYSQDCARMFFRGLLDGDGNVREKGVFRITISNKEYLEKFSEYVNKTLGTSTEVKPDRKYWKIEMRQHDSKVFLDWVYQGFEDFRFQDKYSVYKSFS